MRKCVSVLLNTGRLFVCICVCIYMCVCVCVRVCPCFSTSCVLQKTDVISQRTSVSSVLTGEKDMQSSALGAWLWCVRVSACVYLWLSQRDELLLLHKSASGSPVQDCECIYTVSVCVCVHIDPIHTCSNYGRPHVKVIILLWLDFFFFSFLLGVSWVF